MGRGQKVCPQCSATTGPRSFNCPSCNYAFVFKPKSKENKINKVVKNIDWKSLVKGDKIKVGSGPYYISKGNFIPMGYRGKFVVDHLDDSGIYAYGIDKHSGFAYIYMGPDFQNKETGVWKIKHKILSIKPRLETV